MKAIFSYIVSLFAKWHKKASVVDLMPMSSIGLDRYLGTWYEIARIDHFFERGIQDVSAQYTMLKNGDIKVLNSGIKNGHRKQIYGIAKPTKIAGLLKVSFLRPFYSEYRILYVDKQYKYALVGGSSKEYLWFLARKKFLTPNTWKKLMTEAHSRGYETEQLIRITHTRKDIHPLSLKM